MECKSRYPGTCVHLYNPFVVLVSMVSRDALTRFLTMADPSEIFLNHVLELANTNCRRFRWVTCQIDFLCTLANDRERREALEKLPPTLPETYERILQRANAGGESIQLIVQKSLQWITFSREPLTLSSLAEALSVELGAKHLNLDNIDDEAAILEGCGSLVRVSTPEKVVELAHFTVQECLTSMKA